MLPSTDESCREGLVHPRAKRRDRLRTTISIRICRDHLRSRKTPNRPRRCKLDNDTLTMFARSHGDNPCRSLVEHN